MELTLLSTLPLNNGVQIPRLGLGTYQSKPGRETFDAVLSALEAGYRHIDTAAAYGNEQAVGEAIRKSGVPRKDIFITTKLWTRDHGFESAQRACDRSLRALGTEYVDLYLIHWPGSPVRWESWQGLEKLYKEKKCRAIGVSNYLERHIKEILDRFEVTPAVNQVEFSPFLFQKKLLGYCRDNGIQLEAYSPLTQGVKLGHPVVQSTARKHGKTAAQILIRWALEHELVVIPKSTRRDRIRENSQVFDFAFDADDRKALDGLNEGLRTCWDPSQIR